MAFCDGNRVLDSTKPEYLVEYYQSFRYLVSLIHFLPEFPVFKRLAYSRAGWRSRRRRGSCRPRQTRSAPWARRSRCRSGRGRPRRCQVCRPRRSIADDEVRARRTSCDSYEHLLLEMAWRIRRSADPPLPLRDVSRATVATSRLRGVPLPRVARPARRAQRGVRRSAVPRDDGLWTEAEVRLALFSYGRSSRGRSRLSRNSSRESIGARPDDASEHERVDARGRVPERGG